MKYTYTKVECCTFTDLNQETNAYIKINKTTFNNLECTIRFQLKIF